MPLEIKYNNSAGRLLAVLSAIRSAMTAQNPSHPLLTIYPQFFDGTDAEPAAENIHVNHTSIELYLELNHLIDGVLEDSSELCQNNDDYKLFFKSLTQINLLRVRFSPQSQIKRLTKN